MGDRRFQSRDGNRWDIVARGKREWIFEPVEDNPGPRRIITPPGYEADPFELSIEELQTLLDSSNLAKPRAGKSPFLE